MSFKDKFMFLLDEDNLKIADIARMTNIPASTIYNAINRDFKKMDIKHLGKIAKALDVSMDYLIHDEISDRNYGRFYKDSISIVDEPHLSAIRNYLKLNYEHQVKVQGIIDIYTMEEQQAATVAQGA